MMPSLGKRKSVKRNDVAPVTTEIAAEVLECSFNSMPGKKVRKLLRSRAADSKGMSLAEGKKEVPATS
jgi:hypothetical protein